MAALGSINSPKPVRGRPTWSHTLLLPVLDGVLAPSHLQSDEVLLLGELMLHSHTVSFTLCLQCHVGFQLMPLFGRVIVPGRSNGL